ncbi:MAG TPA: hypothetical protein V6C58_13880 [Allocoleopsis sp.]
MGFREGFKKGLDTVLYEFNPMNDYKNFKFEKYTNKPLNEGLETCLKNHEFIIHSYKPIIRGLLIGTLSGAAYAYISDEEIRNKSIEHASILMGVDFFTYLIRGHVKNIATYFNK